MNWAQWHGDLTNVTVINTWHMDRRRPEQKSPKAIPGHREVGSAQRQWEDT